MKILFGLIIALLFIVCVIFIMNKNINKITKIGPYSSFVVTGGSMYPNLIEGDLIIVKKEDSYKVEDVITYRNDENGITTHRIIRIEDDKYYTKGDSNNYEDGYFILKEDIYGKVKYRIEKINKLIEFIWNYKYLCLAVIIIIPIILKVLSKVA